MDKSIRARVERVLAEDIRPQDLDRIFLYARDRCDGRQCVREIGDFVAHHNERNKGLITQTAKDWAAIVHFHVVPMIEGERHDWFRLPDSFPLYLDATIRRLDQKSLRKAVGMNASQARTAIRALRQRLTTNQDGTLSLPREISSDENDLLRYLSSVLVVREAFNSNALVSDLANTLKSNAVLKKEEYSLFLSRERIIGLFAASVMHNCVVNVSAGTNLVLRIASNDMISVDAAVTVKENQMGGRVQVASSLFSTAILLSEGCHADLLAEKQPWEFCVELSDGKLARLG